MHRVGSAGNTSNSTRPRKEKRLTYVLNDADDTKHCAGINCLTILNPPIPDGCDYLFSGSRDGTLKRWALTDDAATCSTTFESHVDWVNDAVIAGDTLVSCSSDTTLKIWNCFSDGVCTRTLRQHSDYVTCLAAAEKNSNVVASGGLGGEVFIWDLEAALVPVTKSNDAMEDESSNGIITSRNSGLPITSLRSSGSSSSISLHPTQTHQYSPIAAKGHKDSVYALAMNDSGTLLVSGGTEKVVRVWDPRTGSKNMKLRGHTDNIRALLLDSTGRFCLSGSSDSMIRLWDLGQQRCVHSYAVHTDSVWALASTPTFSHVYSGGRDLSLYLTDLATRESLLLCMKEHPILQMALQDDSIWVATTDSSLHRWPAEVYEGRETSRSMGVVSDVKFAKRSLLCLIFVIKAIIGMNSTASLLIDEKLQPKPEDVGTEPGALCSSISTIHVKEHKSVSSEDIRRIPVEHSSSTTNVKNGETAVKLRMLVPTENTFHEFVKMDHDPKGNGMTATGYSVDVFKEVMDSLPYQVSYEFIPYENGQSLDMGYYDELIQQLHLNRYDGVVGDITITSNRSKYGHFTLPYMMSGVSTIVPVKDTYKRSIWWFLTPLTWKWWLAIIVLSLAKGFMLWYFEHEKKPEIKGTLSEQEGKILSFFSISVFVQKENLKTNYARLLVVVWAFGVLVLVTSYAAKLKSTITSDGDRPTVSGIEQLIMNGDFVGYQKGSFVFDLLKHMGFQEEKLKACSSKEEYAIALSRGSCYNGVSAIIDEIPYIKVFLAKYGDRYTMAGPTFGHGGFGFLFHRSCTIVPDISSAVLKFIEGEKMPELEKKWFGFHEIDSYPPQIPEA